MKRLFAPLLALCGLLSCSSDNDTAPDILTLPPSGSYMSVIDGVEVLIVDVNNGQCNQFTVWQADGKRYFVQGFTTSGEWPKYEYTYHAAADGTTVGQSDEVFTMSATFQNDTVFVADYNAHLAMQELAMIDIPQPITFTMDGKGAKFTSFWMPLDANGDGIPDVLQ